MSKNYWYEVYTYENKSVGTITLESFDTLGDAQRYVAENKDKELFIDEWEMNEDGTQVSYRSIN